MSRHYAGTHIDTLDGGMSGRVWIKPSARHQYAVRLDEIAMSEIRQVSLKHAERIQRAKQRRLGYHDGDGGEA